MLLYVALMIIGVGGALALLCGKKHRVATLVGAVSLFSGAAAGLPAMFMGMEFESFFQIPVLILGIAAALYSPGYLAGHGSERSNVYWFFLNLTVASMLAVTVFEHWVPFLLAWEVMGLASAVLVMFDRESTAARKAGWLYFAACHAGAALLILYFMFPECNVYLSLFLVLAGFGLKIGFPLLHIWLPEAHPAAPAPVSALMSGAMIPLGFLGIFKFAHFDTCICLEEYMAFLGWALLILGVAGALGGIIFALPQNNLKRLLAYSSIENMGLISIAFGLCFLGAAAYDIQERVDDISEMVLFSFVGGIIHIINHALLKGGLFLGAGSVLKMTHTLSMDKLGGLMRRAPQSGTLFTLNAAGLCGLPPFGGFIGECLIYYAAFFGVMNGSGALRSAAVAVLIVMALTGGIAVAVYAKAIGAVFLGEPRSQQAADALEVKPLMLTAQYLLFGLSLLFIVILAWTLPEDIDAPLVKNIAILYAAVVVLIAILLWAQRILSRRGVRKSCTWDCGYAKPDARMEYTGTAFTQPLSDLFDPVLKVEKKLIRPETVFPEKASLDERVSDRSVKRFWQPLTELAVMLAEKIHHLQSGNLHFYILLILLTLAGMLIYAMMRG
ncbi:MAG: hypothetical protein IKA71_07470 [Lentisphaeria bacterium]|nr:hypothetical protein [Lentisphaeria bacterium]